MTLKTPQRTAHVFSINHLAHFYRDVLQNEGRVTKKRIQWAKSERDLLALALHDQHVGPIVAYILKATDAAIVYCEKQDTQQAEAIVKAHAQADKLLIDFDKKLIAEDMR